MAKNARDMTNKDLLVRIDERQKQIIKEIEAINCKLDKKLDKAEFAEFCTSDFMPVQKKTEEHEKNWNRMFGYGVGVAVGGGAVGGLVSKAVTAVLAGF